MLTCTVCQNFRSFRRRIERLPLKILVYPLRTLVYIPRNSQKCIVFTVTSWKLEPHHVLKYPVVFLFIAYRLPMQPGE